jgi:hypothetical protein
MNLIKIKNEINEKQNETNKNRGRKLRDKANEEHGVKRK